MPCRTGLFEGVDAKVKPMKKGKSQVRFIFKEKVWPEMQSFRVSPSGQLPSLPPPPHAPPDTHLHAADAATAILPMA